MPMHTLLTDMVESQGGSSVLVRTLNRLGVCSSADTLARFIQHKRSACEYPCIKHLTKDAFTVVSADNLDFLHSFSRVFCGNQKSSWHGTTVQVDHHCPCLNILHCHKCNTRTLPAARSLSLSLLATKKALSLSLLAMKKALSLSLLATEKPLTLLDTQMALSLSHC